MRKAVAIGVLLLIGCKHAMVSPPEIQAQINSYGKVAYAANCQTTELHYPGVDWCFDTTNNTFYPWNGKNYRIGG